MIQRDGKHADLTDAIIRVFYAVYNELGDGFVESVDQGAMKLALSQAGLRIQVEMPISVYFRNQGIGTFKADLVVNNFVLLELKSAAALVKEHHSQTMNYLRATQLEVALLLNFGPASAGEAARSGQRAKGQGLESICAFPCHLC